MLNSYLKLAMRNVLRHRFYSLVNIVGLAVGLAACILIMLFVNHELSYDRWIPDHDRVMRTEVLTTYRGEPTFNSESIQPVVAALMAEQMQGLELSARLMGRSVALATSDKAFDQDIELTDPDVFKLFGIDLIEGDARTSLHRPDSLVLSIGTAHRILGDGPYLGRTLKANGEHLLKVTGIMPDWPRNSDMQPSALAPFNSPIIDNEPWLQTNWGSFTGATYIRLEEGINLGPFTDEYNALAERLAPADYYEDPIEAGGPKTFNYHFTPVLDAHLKSAPGDAEGRGSVEALYAAAMVALFILAIAIMNVTNLGTMIALKRVREVAIRKALGANAKQLVAQISIESVLLSVVSMVLGLALVEMLLPTFGMMMDRPLSSNLLYQPQVILPLAFFTIFVGAVSGFYPALVASRFRPVDYLNGISPKVGVRFRNILMVIQFAATIGLLVTCFVVFKQTEYAGNRNPGFKSSQLVELSGIDRPIVLEREQAFRDELARIPGVEQVAASHGAPGYSFNNFNDVSMIGRRDVTLRRFSVSPEFFEAMGIAPIAGRVFSAQYPSDAYVKDGAGASTSVILNRTAVAKLGFEGPQQALGQVMRTYADMESTIVGVVEDIRLESVKSETEPTYFWIGPNDYRHVILRVSPESMPDTLQTIDQLWSQKFPDIPISRQFVDQAFASYYDDERRRVWLLLGSASVMVIIATMGLFALAALTIERRAREISIRKVLGAKTGNIISLVLWQFATPIFVANLLAWPVAWWLLRRWLETFVDRISLSPTPFLMAGVFVLLVAGLTIVARAARVARANPIKALRCE